jgi:restriction endonuclease Mrr
LHVHKIFFGDDTVNLLYIAIGLTLIVIIITLVSVNHELRERLYILSKFTNNDLWLIGERLKYMTPYEFEEICAKLLNRQNGNHAYTRPQTRDGGVDVVLTQNSETIFIQCKHWLPTDENKSPVGREVAQRLKGAMDYGFDGSYPIKQGIIITTSTYTNDCKIYCDKMGIQMWDTNDILDIVKEVGDKEIYKDFGIDYDGKYVMEG